MSFDTAWFLDRIAESRWKMQRDLAPQMRDRRGEPYDRASLNRLLKGEQKMLASDAVQLARLLGVSLEEVLEHADLDLKGVTLTRKRPRKRS